MNERERLKANSDDEPLQVLVEKAESSLVGLAKAGMVEEEEEARVLHPLWFSPNIVWFLGVLGTATGGMSWLIGFMQRTVLYRSPTFAEPFQVFQMAGLALGAVSLIVLLLSLRRPLELHLGSSSLTLKGRRKTEAFNIKQIRHVEVTWLAGLLIHLDQGTVLLPALSVYRGMPPPTDELKIWLRSKSIPIIFAQDRLGRLLSKEIKLPDFIKPGVNLQMLWLVGTTLSFAPIIIFFFSLTQSGGGLRALSPVLILSLVVTYLVGLAVNLGAAFYKLKLRQKWAKTSLEFADGGMKVVTEGKGTEVEASEIRCILLETKKGLFGFVKKRLVIETHYGRFIPLTRFQHVWPIEAMQILHQAPLYRLKIEFAHEGKKLVLGRLNASASDSKV